MAKGIGFVNHALGIGMNTMGELSNPNISTGQALVRGAFWAGAEALLPGVGMVSTIASVAGMATESYIDHKKYGHNKIKSYYRPGFGGNYQDTQQAYTMRQRSAQALQQTKMNARSVLGSEARTFHTSF